MERYTCLGEGILDWANLILGLIPMLIQIGQVLWRWVEDTSCML
jgi:hypothetical protein